MSHDQIPAQASSESVTRPDPVGPVLDVRVGGIRLTLEVPARLHLLASGLITSGTAAALGYLLAAR
ncbi:hypothetical protein ACFVSN_06805 [Kitasatospora sp. NPDC057904]|uniref:hypothetical protein n=1 Tax=unclassified Kitasatospora TaxID=2633591 RepID=UPI0036D9255A